MHELVKLTGVIMTFIIPLAATVLSLCALIDKHRKEYELRQSIVENKVDADIANLLIKKTRKPIGINYAVIRWGLLLVCAGIAAFIATACGLDGKYDFIFWMAIATGCGVGLVIAFAIEYWIKGKKRLANDSE